MILRNVRGSTIPVSAAAGIVHAAEIPNHLSEYFTFGAFFLLVAWFQVGWATLAALRWTRRLKVTGVIGNVFIVGVWAVRRTVGLPFGPEPGVAESVAAVDLFATGLEVLLISALALLLTAEDEGEISARISPAWWVTAVVVGMSAVILLSARAAPVHAP